MTKKPNLLFIWTDQQCASTLPCYGNPDTVTPNFDKLAAESFVFENAYCTQPVCTPSRASIMTGLYPHTHGCIRNNTPLPADTLTMGELVCDEYHKGYYGKWHLGDEIVAQHGFQEWISIEDAIYRPFFSKSEYLERFSDYHYFIESQGFFPDSKSHDGKPVYSRNFTAAMAEQYTKSRFLADKASDFISRQSDERPWLLNVNFLEPHTPYWSHFNDRYEPESLSEGPAFLKEPDHNHSLRSRLFAHIHRDQPTRRLRANYYGLVSLIDQEVGRILDTLEKSGMVDDTIVVFTSDHGDMMGEHGILAKCVMYEPASKIPLMIKIPGLNASGMVPGRVSQVDLLPTLLELMGQDLPDHLQGDSRADVLEGRADLSRNDVITQWHGNECIPTKLEGFADEDLEQCRDQVWRNLIGHDGWKLNLCNKDEAELFNLNEDPDELHNLIGEPQYQEKVVELKSRLRDWQARHGDEMELY